MEYLRMYSLDELKKLSEETKADYIALRIPYKEAMARMRAIAAEIARRFDADMNWLKGNSLSNG